LDFRATSKKQRRRLRIRLDQHQSGADSAIPPTELDHHFAMCTACAVYAELSRKVDAFMSTALTSSHGLLDLVSIRARIAKGRRHTAFNRLMFPIVFAVGIAIFLIANGKSPALAVALSVGFAAFPLTSAATTTGTITATATFP
jgi:hypothetical protein